MVSNYYGNRSYRIEYKEYDLMTTYMLDRNTYTYILLSSKSKKHNLENIF